MAKPNLTAERLRELLHYDPDTGFFTRILYLCSQAQIGGAPGHAARYLRIQIDGRCYYAHRLAWLYMTGEWPNDMIDHINGNKTDNRFSNLRDATRSTNMQNRRYATQNSASGILGVYKSKNRWKAQIKFMGRLIVLGNFETKESAYDAYVIAKRKHHPGCTI